MKKQKGITLIALIITIIVMLILVGVSVTVALNGGLFKTAKQAAEQTKLAVQEETGLKYEYEIAKARGEYNGSYELYCAEKELKEKYGVKIGDKVNYDAGEEDYEGDWIVIGIENGNMLIMSTKTVGSVRLSIGAAPGIGHSIEDRKLGGVFISELNEMCNTYDNGEFAIEGSARSLKLEDIDNLTGYDKRQYKVGQVEQYGNTVTITLSKKFSTDRAISYTVKDKTSLDGSTTVGSESYTPEIYDLNNNKLKPGDSFSVEYNYYTYDVNSYSLPTSIKDILNLDYQYKNSEYDTLGMPGGIWLANETVSVMKDVPNAPYNPAYPIWLAYGHSFIASGKIGICPTYINFGSNDWTRKADVICVLEINPTNLTYDKVNSIWNLS